MMSDAGMTFALPEYINKRNSEFLNAGLPDWLP
jgi:hypothetical protein